MKLARYVVLVALVEVATAAIVAIILRSNPGAVDDATRTIVTRCVGAAAASQGQPASGSIASSASTLLLVATGVYCGVRWERRRARREAKTAAAANSDTGAR